MTRKTLTLRKKNTEDFDGKTKQELIDEVLKNRASWQEYYSHNNQNYIDNITFLYETQFSDEEEKAYSDDNRPMLQANLLYKISTQLDAEFNSNSYTSKVRPTTDLIDPKQQQGAIDLRQNVLNYIDIISSNSSKKTAFSQAKDGGYSSIHLHIEEDTSNPFQQIIKHKSIHNPTLDFWDSSIRGEDNFKQDGQFCGTHTLMSKHKAKQLYPDLDIENITSLPPEYNFEWERSDNLWFVDYWKKVKVKRMLARTTGGQMIPVNDEESSNIDENQGRNNRLGLIDKPTSLQRGNQQFFVLEKQIDEKAFKIKHYRFANNEVLEDRDWPGIYLPVMFVPGNSKFVVDREKTISLIYFAKDAQRFHNFILNEIALRFKLSRYEPYLATTEMTKGLEKMWANNAQPKNVLYFNKNINDPNERPIRQTPSEVPQSLFHQQTFSEHLIQAVSGRFDASFGAPSNELSGAAITNRAMGSNSSSKIYFDNFRDAWEVVLKAELDMMKHIFDNTRNIPLPDNNNNIRFTKINDPQNPATDLTVGDFSVSVKVGNSFEIQKQQNLELLSKMTTAYPALMPYTIDLLIENLDIPNATKLVERVRSSGIVNPQVILNESTNPKELQVAQQNMQKQQQQQQMQQQMVQTQMQMAQQKVANDSTRAHADQMRAVGQSTADLQNAQTNRLEAIMKGAVESDKLKAEQDRTNLELDKVAFQTARQGEKSFSGGDRAFL